jgi:hypothetical protein
MSEPKIFAELVSETGDILHATEQRWDAFTRHIGHRRYHQTSTPATPATEASVSTILSEIHSAVTEGVSNIKGWAGDLENELPKLAALASKYENSPIVKELEALGEVVLPPEVEQSIVGLIQMGSKLVSGAAGAVSAPAAPVAADGAPAAVDAPVQPAAPVVG